MNNTSRLPFTAAGLILAWLALFVSASRPKEKDEHGERLAPLNQLFTTCSTSAYFGLGMVDGHLEHCERYAQAAAPDGDADEYEQYKCRVLRVHGRMVGGKCECEDQWKGSICNEYDGCPTGYSTYGGVCTPNVCQHNGTLAVGSKQIECICPVPWDGRYCDRLACWRKTDKEHERRWRNAVTVCACGDGYDGDNCDQAMFCKNGGELVKSRCQCKEGFYGELCEKKCRGNVPCSATRTFFLFPLLSLAASLVLIVVPQR